MKSHWVLIAALSLCFALGACGADDPHTVTEPEPQWPGGQSASWVLHPNGCGADCQNLIRLSQFDEQAILTVKLSVGARLDASVAITAEEVTRGLRLADSALAGLHDRFDGCGGVSFEEQIYRAHGDAIDFGAIQGCHTAEVVAFKSYLEELVDEHFPDRWDP